MITPYGVVYNCDFTQIQSKLMAPCSLISHLNFKGASPTGMYKNQTGCELATSFCDLFDLHFL